MADLFSRIAKMRRPRLLVHAARIGTAEYCRNRDLKRIMRCTRMPSPASALAQLLTEEERLNESRAAGDAAYSIARHVDVLIALMAEMSLLSTGRRSA